MSESKDLGLKMGACMGPGAQRWPQPGHMGPEASPTCPRQCPPASGPQREWWLWMSELATQQNQGPSLKNLTPVDSPDV